MKINYIIYSHLLTLCFSLLIVGCKDRPTIVIESAIGIEKVFIEHLTLNSTTTVDSAIKNSSGRYVLKGSYPKGIYALRYGLHGEDYVLFCYNANPIQVNLDTSQAIFISNIEGDTIVEKFNKYVNKVCLVRLANEEFIAKGNQADKIAIYQNTIKDKLIDYALEAGNEYALIYLFTLLDKQDDIRLLSDIQQRVMLEPYAEQMKTILNRNQAILDSFVYNH